MPTRFINPNILRRVFDSLVPPNAVPKDFLRWGELARHVGLNSHWIRKRYQGRMQSELDVRSIHLLRRALERKLVETKDPAVGLLIEQLSAAAEDQTEKQAIPVPSLMDGEPHKMRVVNLGLIREGSASYVMRLESGIRSGVTHGLRSTHLVADESLDLAGAALPSQHAKAIKGLLNRFNTQAAYVDRTYLICLGTSATSTLATLLRSDAHFRRRLGHDFRIIFAAVTNPATTGILEFERDYIGGMVYGDTAVERIRFIQEAFPGRPLAYLYDPALVPDRYILEEIRQHPELDVLPVPIRRQTPTRVPRQARGRLIMGWYFVNLRIHELVLANPDFAFVGTNTADLSRGAVLSTGNDDFQSGIDCVRRLIIPDLRNEINLHDTPVLKPQPVWGVNEKACNLHALVPKVTARNRCKVIVV
jgi:hypothetical protein